MLIRHLVPVAAVAALVIAAPAAAQSTTWSHSGGLMTLTVPSVMAPHPMGVERDEKGLFVVRRGAATVGTCIASVEVNSEPASQEVWKMVIGAYTGNPDSSARSSTEQAGHAYIRLLGSKAYRSLGGWDGYVYWFERTNKTSGKTQTMFNASTMLDASHRFVAVCASMADYVFEPAEIQAITGFITSARRP